MPPHPSPWGPKGERRTNGIFPFPSARVDVDDQEGEREVGTEIAHPANEANEELCRRRYIGRSLMGVSAEGTGKDLAILNSAGLA